MNLLDLVQRESGYTFDRKTLAGEYEGPCPFCGEGDDRFLIWTANNRYWCRVCDSKGDAIQFLRDFKHMSFAEAKAYVGEDIGAYTNGATTQRVQPQAKPPEPQMPPTGTWAEQAWMFAMRCHEQLMDRVAPPKALAWLQGRGLARETLRDFCIGYNPADTYVDRSEWGLPEEQGKDGKPKRLWLPRGVVIPWIIGDDLWGIRIRRPVGDPKYYWLPGGTPALYLADRVLADCPVMVLEGEFDALVVWQEARHLVTPVATGSTHGARRAKWIARIAQTPVALVSFDADDAGERAASYWLETLGNAKRWRPYWSDVNDLAQAGVDIRTWVSSGL